MSQSQSHTENTLSADRARPQEHADALFEFGSPHVGTEGPPAAVPLGELTETDAARITVGSPYGVESCRRGSYDPLCGSGPARRNLLWFTVHD